jgi:hypothetical protein
MHLNKKAAWTRVMFILLMTGMLGLSLMPAASAADRGDIKKVQESLRDKGYAPGQIDGVLDPQTREANRRTLSLGREVKADILVEAFY